MIRLTFDKKWIDEYWQEVEPKVMSSISSFEARESWVVEDQSPSLRELNRIAENLPQLANFPLNQDVQEQADRLLVILGCLPLKTSLAAFGWLGAFSQNDHKWNYIVSIHANQTLASQRIENRNRYKFAKILHTRLNLFNFLIEFDKQYLSDDATRLALATHKRLIQENTKDG
ncbi:hypothetical protein C4D07_RS16865 [Vibrio parahaemolyticus]|uniref:type IVB secretion system protein IcmW n=1 Tax=Vibrio antiquarius (strain Ex25) TaxID=150340 RepID=UPI003F6899B0|nr:hypothetical protein [Vibrio parahaemolyticus]